ncbi:MAG: hypothetical protein ACLUKN_05955 [Bacilli bacterium]
MVATSESGLIKMDKKSFIDRIATAENAERKAAKLPEFSADDTTSTTQTQGKPSMRLKGTSRQTMAK